ncbi:MAG TPA: glycosyltransferase 87 family protein [Candidatus Polarisedimenticolia bacterium]|nr:glycosyltransferase 87 family protein [Candidatus Polarisedimenticolia bacterium]
MSPQTRADIAYLAAIILGVLFVVLLGPLDRRLELLHINDFSGFWAGPRAVLAGVSPWDPANYPAARIAFDTQRDDASVLNYMPWTVIALLPLGLLPLEVAAWIWMALSMILGAVALRALLREFMPGRAVVHGMLGLALFAGQPGFHTIVLGQWALLLMSAVAAIVLAVRADHARRAGLAALALLAKPQLFVWTALGLAIPAFFDRRYRRFVAFAVVVAGALVISAWLAFPDWFPAWIQDIPARRTGRSAVLFSAFGQLFGTPGRVLAIGVIAAGLVLASRFVPGSDPWLAIWLALSGAGAIYSWSYDHVLLFVPLVIASGVLAAAGRERAATRLAIGGALTFLLVSPIFYAVGVARHDETFSIAVPVALFVAIAWSLWPYRRGELVRQRPAQQVQPA